MNRLASQLRILALSAVISLAVACSSEQHRELDSAGRLCAYPEGTVEGFNGDLQENAQESYAPDDSVKMVVSYGCAPCNIRDFQATCSVTQGDSSLSVASHASFTLVDVSGTCPNSCLPLVARCTTTPLSAGAYTVGYGSETLQLTVPSEVQTPCLGAVTVSLFQ